MHVVRHVHDRVVVGSLTQPLPVRAEPVHHEVRDRRGSIPPVPQQRECSDDGCVDRNDQVQSIVTMDVMRDIVLIRNP